MANGHAEQFRKRVVGGSHSVKIYMGEASFFLSARTSISIELFLRQPNREYAFGGARRIRRRLLFPVCSG